MNCRPRAASTIDYFIQSILRLCSVTIPLIENYDAGVWDKEFWEGDLVYYTCENPIDDGVVLNPKLVGPDGGQVGNEAYECRPLFG